MEAKQILKDLLDLQEKYTFIKRNLVTGDRYEQIALSGLVRADDYTNEVLREPLLEHVGHLPVIASFLHPYIEHRKKIDLGRTLIMLSIHDIGETEMGDIHTYAKTVEDGSEEFEAAMRMLDEHLSPYYEEFEQRETFDSRYAKAIDALAPIVHTMYRPHIKLEHFKLKGFTIDDVVKNKAYYFKWDQVLNEIFELSIEHYRMAERGEEPLLVKGKSI